MIMKKLLILLILLFTLTSLSSDSLVDLWRVYASGRYVYIENVASGRLIEGGSNTIEFRKILISDTAYRIYKDGVDQLNDTIGILQMVNKSDVAYTSETFETWKEANTGFNPPEVTGLTKTGVALDLSNAVGNYYNMASANAGETYTFSGGIVGGWAISLINTTNEPDVTSGTKIAGADWVTATDMYLVVRYNGTATQFFFLEI